MNQNVNNSEARLSKALRSLAANSPSGAPAEVGEALAQAFRRHHARRRIVRRSTIVAVIVILTALPSVLVRSRRQVVETPRQGAGSAVSNAPSPLTARSDLLPKKATASRPRIHQRPVTTRMNAAARPDDFVPLPSYGLRGQAEDLRIVRLQVNGRALRVVGAPVIGDIDERPVLADFVVGQDGTPYAVRLLRQNVR